MKKIPAILAVLLTFASMSFSQTTAALNAVQMASSSVVFAAGSSGAALGSTDGGVTWTNQTSGTALTITSLSFASTSVGWACASNALYGYNVILKTTNGGTSWVSQSSGVSVGSLNGISAASTSIVVAVGKSSTTQALIVFTTNGGTSWATATGAGVNPLYGVHLISTTVGVAVGWAGAIAKTTDGGATWSASQVSGAGADVFTHVTFSTANNGWLTGTTGVIYHSTDAGASWTQQRRTGTGTLDLYSISMIADTGNACGAGGLVLRTSNAGATWTTQVSHTPYTLQGISFTDKNTGIMVGGYGTILKTTDGGSTWGVATSVTCNAVPASPNLISPANGTTGLPTTVTLSWSPVTCADSYVLHLVVGDSTHVDSLVKATTYTVSGLSNSAPCSWYVTAQNASGVSVNSSTWTFSVGAGVPGISVSPTSIAFGNKVIGTPTTKKDTITNTGSSPLIVNSIVTNNTQFTVSPSSISSIAPSATSVVTITYTPTQSKGVSGTLFYYTNASATATTVPITGKGVRH